jgi:hypothetical protein
MNLRKLNTKIEVFYLVRWSNPVNLTSRFAKSYLSCAAGADHKLTLICKGFENRADIDDHCSQFDNAPLSVIDLPDTGYDIGAYRTALDLSLSDHCCFLNSYSIIQAQGWLESFSAYSQNPNIGIVGATASYEGPFSDVLKDPNVEKINPGSSWRHIAGTLRNWAYFPTFPNPHIRTNAFMMSRRLCQAIRWPRDPSKFEALKFESGHRNLTRQVLKMGLDAIIVGRDGKSYGISEWPSSGTFRQSGQHNVLVADNRTLEYADAVPELKRQLAIKAWGLNAAEQPH